MALEVVGSVVMEKVIGELVKPFVDGGKKAAAFSDILQRVKSIIKIIAPTVDRIKNSSGELDRREENEELIQLFDEGEKLVQKCSKVRWWTPNRWKYANKLTAFYKSLLQLFQFRIPLQQYSISLEILGRQQSQFRSGNGGVSGRIPSSLGNSCRSFGSGSLNLCSSPDPPDFMVGLDLPLKEVKKRLLKDNVSKIVVSAPGGCGKTTLVRKLCQDPDVKGEFKDNIFYVTVSKMHNLKLIVGNLLEHNGFRVPEFLTDEDAINQLEQLLKNQARIGPILLILDDVWEEPEFPLQKFSFKIPDYKILVTSRYEFPSFGSTYKLKLLNDEDAMRLFRYSAFRSDGDVDEEDFDEDLVNEIVKRCGGFPLALQVVGGSLCEQPIQVWERRLMELSKGQSIFYSEKRVLDCLQLSLASLDDEQKECFMDLGLFPEDRKIPVTALIDMWAELYKLDKNGVQAISNLHKLSSQNLLNLVVTRKDASEADGCYDDAFVLQHDLLRDLAIHQSSQKPMEERKRLILDLTENKLPEWWTEGKQPCIKARLMSISSDQMFSSSWCNMQVPEVEALILNFQTTENYTLPNFMNQMENLKVLTVTNYGSSAAELINFSVIGSLSNLKRIRFEQVSIPPSLCDSMVELKNLQKISLVMCKINQALTSSSIQIPNMFPNLTEINIDYCNDLVRFPVGLCDLLQLKKLSISNCHRLSALPEGIGKLENLELLRLHTCTKLQGLPDSIRNLHRLTVLDITGCFRVKKLPKHMDELCSLKKMYMRKCRGLRELPASIIDLKKLKKVVCDTETAQLWEEHPFANLKISIPEETIDLNWLES